jgi:hypothetical protein
MVTREGKNQFEVVVVDGIIIKYVLKEIEWEVTNCILVSRLGPMAGACKAVMKTEVL